MRNYPSLRGNFIRWLLWILWLAVPAGHATTPATLFSDNFDTYAEGPVQGQGGWTPVFPTGWAQPAQPHPYFYSTTFPITSGLYSGKMALMTGAHFRAEHTVPEALPEDALEVSFWALRAWCSPLDIYSGSPQSSEIFAFNGVRLALASELYAWDAVLSQWVHVRQSEASHKWYDATGYYQDFSKVTVRLDGLTRQYSVQVDGGPVKEGLSFVPETGDLKLAFHNNQVGVLMVDDVLVKRVQEDEFSWDNPLDSDGDGIPDWWELYLGSNPLAADAQERAQGAAHTYLQRYQALSAGRPDPDGIFTPPDMGGISPGYTGKLDSDKDGFTDYQESYFGYNKDDQADHPPPPRYVVIDLGAGQEPFRISAENGWVLAPGARWHDGTWRGLIPDFQGTDINSTGCVLGTGVLCADYGWKGYYMNAQGQRASISAPGFDHSIGFTHPGSEKGMAWGHLFAGQDRVIYNPAAFGDFNAGAERGNEYNLGFIGLSKGSLGTAPGKMAECPAGSRRVDANSVFGRHGALIEWVYPQDDMPVESWVTPNPSSLPFLSDTDATTEQYALVRFHDVNRELVAVGESDWLSGDPVWGQDGVTTSLLHLDRTNQATGAAYCINAPADNNYLIAARSHVWERKRTADGSFVAPLEFGRPERLAALVDWNCGWVDQWNITALNDAGYLVGTGYKIKPGQEAKTTGGELIIDFKDKQYSVNNQPTAAIEQHGFLMLPMEVRGLVTMSQNTGRSFKRWVVTDDAAPGGVMTRLVNELEIAQWYNPIERYDFPNQKIVFNEQGLYLDPDAFYVRIQAPPPPDNEKYQVRIWTTDCSDAEYSDAGAVVDLIHCGDGIYQTEPLYLVADKNDALTNIGSTTGRRAFCVQLGGQVRFRFLGWGRPNNNEADRILPVPAKKVLKLQGFHMKKSGFFSDTFYGNINDLRLMLKRAKERMATCGIRVEGSIEIREVPAGVDLDNDLDLIAGLDPDYKIWMAAECKALLGGVSVNAETIPFFHVPYQNPTINHGSLGFSWIPVVLYPADSAYGNRILLNTRYDSEEYGTNVLEYSLGHELLHVLMNALHAWSLSPNENDIIKYTDDYKMKPKSLWYGGASNNPDIYQSKRISDEMKHDLLKSHFLKNP